LRRLSGPLPLPYHLTEATLDANVLLEGSFHRGAGVIITLYPTFSESEPISDDENGSTMRLED
jgi:hypothetical protein